MSRLLSLHRVPPPLVAILTAFVPALIACDGTTGPGDGPPELLDALPRPLTVAESEVVASNNDFALRLFSTMAKAEPDSNLVISPLSVSMALGMTMNGAANETFDAMRSTLGFENLTIDEINESYRDLIDLLLGLDPGTDTRIANSIWYRETLSVKQPFIDAARSFFDAVVQSADFEDPATIDLINTWVEEQTNGRIPTILDSIEPDEVMFLINAIYFKGQWRAQFDKDLTRDDVFTLSDGSELPVKMMSSEDHPILLLRNDLFSAADLLYGNGAFTMTVLLPHRELGVNAMIDSLDASRWNGWMAGLSETAMLVELPRWRLEWDDSLNTALRTLGMDIAFDSRADFSGISSVGGLYISRVDHKTFIEVNEEGTEAAAVTNVVISTTSTVIPRFRVDRPFVFAIRERFSGTILFIGRVTRPIEMS